MKVLVQRSLNSCVSVDNKIVGKIDFGLVLFIGFTQTDTIDDIDYMINKVINLRIFDDENGIMNKSLLDVGGSILSVSQFTLYADTKKGRRPSYSKALNSTEALKLYNIFNDKIKNMGINIEKGIFQSEMKVSITNDGPITIMIESEC